jgi:Cu+-exporting ATPase
MTAASTEHVELPITRMTCTSCVARIEKQLNKLAGVDASVSLATETASVDYDAGLVEPERLVKAIEAAGYQAALPAPTPKEQDADEDATAPLRRRLLLGVVLSVPVLLLSMVPGLQFENWQWLALQLATPVVLWAGWPFHKAAWENLKHGAATMDTLISVGTLAAWGWSVYALFLGDAGMPGMKMSFELIPAAGSGSSDIYLEVASVVTTAILAGRYFESRAKRRAGAALRALLELGAKDVAVLDESGVEL